MQNRRLTNFKQPWYDRECEAARTHSFNRLKIFKKSNLPSDKISYQEANTEYKNICCTKRRLYYLQIEADLNSTNNCKDFWAMVRRLNGQSGRKGIKADTVSLADHFKQLLFKPETSISRFADAFNVEVAELDAPITLEEVEIALNQAKTHKAPGEDQITAEFLKNATPELKQMLTSAYNAIYDSASVPERFKRSLIFPIFKKGDDRLASNYRGITFLNVVMKVFTAILLVRMTEWVNKNHLLSEYQSGFRKGFSTVDSIYTLTSIVRYYLDKKKKMYLFFIDFRAAFDTIVRNAHFYKLQNLGLSSKLLKVIHPYYE